MISIMWPFKFATFCLEIFQNSEYFASFLFFQYLGAFFLFTTSGVGYLFTLMNYSHVLAIAFALVFTLLAMFYFKLQQSVKYLWLISS